MRQTETSRVIDLKSQNLANVDWLIEFRQTASPVMKFSWSRSSTVRRSIAEGTNSKPVLEQRMARDGERLWHMQRLGHGCPLHTAASNSKDNHSLSILLHLKQGNWNTQRNEAWIQVDTRRALVNTGRRAEETTLGESLTYWDLWPVSKMMQCLPIY